jgi:hypothetical protein
MHEANPSSSIIQDCEDALTNWVPQKAAVSSKLSTRARTLSQRRRAKAEGVDLAEQDRPLKGDRDSWVNADQHADGYDEDEEEEEGSTAEERGREEERAHAV